MVKGKSEVGEDGETSDEKMHTCAVIIGDNYVIQSGLVIRWV